MSGPRHAPPFAVLGGALAATLIVLAPGPAARAESGQIPNLAAAEYGWQSNVADWQDPPAGHGHGPIKPDPEHPFTSNVNALRAGTQPTLRIGNAKDPVLKPWAAAAMQASNDEALKGERAVPFAAQARCYPGGVPGQLLFPFEPLYFIQTPKEVWMIWQRDHMVRRVFLTDKHSEHVTPSWFGELDRPLRERRHAGHRHHRSLHRQQLHRQFPHAAHRASCTWSSASPSSPAASS